MPKSGLTQGTIVVLTTGRFAGRKAIILKSYLEGYQDKTNEKLSRQFAHCIVAGIDKYPKKVTSKMGAKTTLRRTRVKPFVKVINANHLIATRYRLTKTQTNALTNVVDPNTVIGSKNLRGARQNVRDYLQKMHRAGDHTYFFSKLKF